MTFTPELPTEPGAYWWKSDPEDSCFKLFRVDELTGDLVVYDDIEWSNLTDIGGLWCRLVPADETVPKEEVEKAYLEGRRDANCGIGSCDDNWNDSRAKRVLEGMK